MEIFRFEENPALCPPPPPPRILSSDVPPSARPQEINPLDVASTPLPLPIVQNPFVNPPVCPPPPSEEEIVGCALPREIETHGVALGDRILPSDPHGDRIFQSNPLGVDGHPPGLFEDSLKACGCL